MLVAVAAYALIAHAQEIEIVNEGIMRASAEKHGTQSQQYVAARSQIPTPKPTAPRTLGVRYNPYAEEVASYIRKVWGPNAERAISVAQCESGLYPSALNNNPATRDYSVGIFQINLYGALAVNRPSEAWLKVYQNNVDYAYQMFLAQGWKPWSCAR